ncbi:hypothetical protein F4054_00365 [Candidatus Poribacteria bacterium]|nr:hypothetical protein [Candidatus Poribacteria bacterium]MYK20698.1 hypothetical protein [Candidatus Poribacteria bacterium]
MSDVKFIKRDVHNSMLKRSQLKKDDLVFTITGRIGSVAVVPSNFEGNINQHSVRFQLETQITNIAINPRYVAIFLNLALGQSLSMREVTGGTRPALDYKALYSLKTILPPTNIQNHIVSIMLSAYAQKKQKQQEANALLDSIGNYVLKELGIEMPEAEKKKRFVVYAGDIEGRFDPVYMQNMSKIRNLKTPYPLTPLGKLLTEKPQYGANERAVDGNPEADIRYIRITDIDDYGNLLDDWKTAEAIHSKYLLEENDVLFARSGSVGRAFVYKNGFGKAIFAGYLLRFKFDPEKINPSFVLYYTFTKIYKLWLQSIQRTAAQPNINSKEFQSLEIPLPPLAVQNRIVVEVDKRLVDVAKLRQEADAIVEQAKERVERMLL